MRKLVLLPPLVLAALVGGTLLAAYVYASGREDRIANGISAGDTDLSGLTPAEARAALTRRLEAPRRRPITVSGPDGRQWKLAPEQVKARANVDALVREAMRRTTEGSFLDRAARGIAGERLDVRLDPRVRFSHEAVSELVRRAEKEVERPARDASIRPGLTRLERVPGHNGRAMRTNRLRRALVRAIRDPDAEPDLRVETYETKPKVTLDDLPASYPAYIAVDRRNFKLRLFRGLRLAETYEIAVGAQGYETTAGVYAIQSKQVNPTWHVPKRKWAGELAGKVIPPGPKNPLKARFLGFNGGAGIHGTANVASLGTAASHGCIRMSIPDVKRLADQVEVGTPVYIG